VVRPRAGDDPGTVPHGLDDDPVQVLLLGVLERRGLPRGARDDQAVTAVVDELRGEGGGGVEVDATVGGERRDHGGHERTEREDAGGGVSHG